MDEVRDSEYYTLDRQIREHVSNKRKSLKILRCQAQHPEGGQCELRAGHEFEEHIAGMILWSDDAGKRPALA